MNRTSNWLSGIVAAASGLALSASFALAQTQAPISPYQPIVPRAKSAAASSDSPLPPPPKSVVEIEKGQQAVPQPPQTNKGIPQPLPTAPRQLDRNNPSPPRVVLPPRSTPNPATNPRYAPPESRSRFRLFNGTIARRISNFFSGRSDNTRQQESRSAAPYRTTAKITWVSPKNTGKTTGKEPPLAGKVVPGEKNSYVIPEGQVPRKPSLRQLHHDLIRACGNDARILSMRLNKDGKLDLKVEVASHKNVEAVMQRIFNVPGMGFYEVGELHFQEPMPAAQQQQPVSRPPQRNSFGIFRRR